MYNDEQDYSAVYLKDEALRTIADLSEDKWREKKENKNFTTDMSSELGIIFYGKDDKYLYMARGGIYDFASEASTICTYGGLILGIESNIPVIGKYSGAFADIATIGGAVSTYIANYPIGRQDFEDVITATLDSIKTEDKSISLHRNSSNCKYEEIFKCKAWYGDYINRYIELKKHSPILIRTDFKTMYSESII